MKKYNIVSEYKHKVVVFGSRNAIDDSVVKREVKELARFIAKGKLTLVNGGSKDGVMGYCAEMVNKNGGETYGIGLHNYEPYNAKSHAYYTNHEGYVSHWERQRRLIELGDVFVAFKGGFGTLHEIIDIYLTQGLAEVTAPLILIGEYMENFQTLIGFFEKEKMGRHMLLKNNLHYVKTAKEAEPIIQKHIAKLKKDLYFGVDFYPAMTPVQIYNHIRLNGQPYYMMFENIAIKVLPDVFPSNRFRSSQLLGSYVKKYTKNKRILDMGCASGSMGLIAAKNGAKAVVQVDLNPKATKNARVNAKELGVADMCEVYTGDGFKPLIYKYENYFDLIFFNPPFHSFVKNTEDKSELMYAFDMQGKEGGVIDTFFRQAKNFLSKHGELVIVFSNKDPKAMRYLEEVMVRYGYVFNVDILSKHSTADVRVYRAKSMKEKLPVLKINSQVLRIGVLLAKTGNARVDGLQIKNAIGLAVGELMESGERIELGFGNDKSSVSGAVSGAVSLMESFKPHVIMGPTWSEFIDSVAPYYEHNKTPYYVPATSLDILHTKDLNYVLAGAYSVKNKGNVLKEWFSQESCEYIIYITRTNVLWGSVHQDIFKQEASKSGKEFIFIDLPEKISRTYISKLVDKIKKYDKAVVIIDNYEDFFYDFLVSMKKKKIHTPVVCTLNLAQELRESMKLLEPSSALYELNMPVPKRFIEKYKNKYKQKPSRYAFNAYIGIFVLVRAFKENPKNIKQWIVNNWSDEIYAQSFSFAKSGQIKGQNWRVERIRI